MPVVYRSGIRIVRLQDGVRRAAVPVDAPVLFGVHDEIASHYGREPGSYRPHAATLDYLVAAAGG